jgi:hypothetical protein
LRTALDLGRLLWRFDALAAIDGFLRIGVPHELLILEIDRFKGYRGVRQLRKIAPLADARSESPGESALRMRFYDLGLPVPIPQLEIFRADGRFLARADLAVESLRFIAEYDGGAWHGPAQAAEDDRRRDALRAAGWTVCVFRNEHFARGRTFVDDTLRDGIREARVRLGTGSREPAYEP